jgi:hypothetical protein
MKESMKKPTRIVLIIAALFVCLAAAAAVFLPRSVNERRGEVSGQANTVSQLVDAAYALVDSNAQEPYKKANELFEARIRNETDAGRRVLLRLAYADFLTNHEQAGHALDELKKIDDGPLSDEQKFHLYASFVSAYTQLGDTESSKIYEEKISALPRDVTYIGEGY